MTNNPWTPEEIETLRSMLAEKMLTHKQIGAELGRSEGAVQMLCKRLGMSRDQIRRNGGKQWSETEDEMLGQMVAARMVHREIAKSLGRSVASVNMRIFALKLTPGKNHTGTATGYKAAIGSETLLIDKGLVMRKVANTGRQSHDWKRVDVIDWEAVHGPVPAGHVLLVINKHLPRTPDNLLLVKKEDAWKTIRGVDLPPEVRELMRMGMEIAKAMRRQNAA